MIDINPGHADFEKVTWGLVPSSFVLMLALLVFFTGLGRMVQDIYARQRDIAEGVQWRDPEQLQNWIGELSKSEPVVVYCAYGFDVGRNVTKTLIERGFDARFVRGGISAWYAAGGARALKPNG